MIVETIRQALAGRKAWLVGGVVRDRLLGRDTADVDLALEGDVREAAHALARADGAAAFPLSDEFGAWRVVARDRSWQADLNPLRGGSLAADLALRDFTVNAMAEPLAGGERVDPHGGAADLAARRLRAVGPDALRGDPLRALRAVRLAGALGLQVEEETARLVRAAAPAVAGVAQERVFAELRAILAGPTVVPDLERMAVLGVTAAILPELEALRGVEQNRYHHRDVYGHTLEVLERVVALQADPRAHLGAEHAAPVTALLAEPLADELTRGTALRIGALLHDAAKPATLAHRPDGSPTFMGHDREGAELARGVLARLRTSERLRAHVAALTLHHLRLGFMVADRPPTSRALFRYLTTCEPVEVDVTLLSVADRLATRGRKADVAIAAHLEVARDVVPAALRWRAEGRPAPLVRGDELAREIGLTPGPALGGLLAKIEEARYAGEVVSRADAVALGRRLAAEEA